MSVESLTALIVAIAALLGHVPAVVALLRRTSTPAPPPSSNGRHSVSLGGGGELP